MTTLYDAYINKDSRVRAQFDAQPESLFTACVAGSKRAPGIDLGITDYQRLLGISKLPLSGDEALVITGQQPGLFTGPLYTILKAVTAVQVAKALDATDRRAVPLFWVAGDDHDFEEVRTVHFLDRRNEVLSFSYAPEDPGALAGDVPMYRIPLSPSLHAMINEAARGCTNSEYGAEVEGFLHESLDKAHSLSQWFSLIMAKLFERTELRIFEPYLDEARLAAAPVMRREIESPLHSTRLLIEEGRKLEALGFEAPIKRNEEACNFFVEVEGRRRRVFFKSGRYSIDGTGQTLSVGEMLDVLESSPALFSPNVALRPIVQQHLFAPRAYVAGPGEIAYWAQLKPLFTCFNLPMPVVYPRIRAIITSRKLNQILEKNCLNKEDVLASNDLLERVLREEDTPYLKAFDEERSHLEGAVTKLTNSVLETGSSSEIRSVLSAFQRQTFDGLDKLEKSLLYSDKVKRAAAEQRLQRLQNTLLPLGKPQERVFSIFSFLFAHGWKLIDRMLEELDHEADCLQEMEL